MSVNETRPKNSSGCVEQPSAEISLVIQPREKDLGGFSVRRVLPYTKQRSVGPFVFFDHMGPAEFSVGDGINVRSHPHIGLATITYLFEGEILHKDSLGYEQIIKPGAINLMTAGKGIVHAEKTRDVVREKGQKLHGLQLWIALPDDQEECEPSFEHYAAEGIPETERAGVQVRVLMGEAFGLQSPVKTLSKTIYAELKMAQGSVLDVPLVTERAIYIVSGELKIGEQVFAQNQMLILNSDSEVELIANQTSTLVFIAGDSVGQRHIYWNFVSSSKERIEQAKSDWREGRFAQVQGESDFIPLPHE